MAGALLSSDSFFYPLLYKELFLMKTTIRFENVSKRYNLGLTRTSLPTIVSNWFKKSVNGRSKESKENQFLWALKNVSFELGEGQSLALIGQNGAGKTTILKLLSNITKPTSGRIETNGRLAALIELGAGFHGDLTGRENIFLNGTVLGLDRSYIKSRFDEIVDFSELEGFIDTPIKRYSSGMKVRLGFAVASCIESEIFLVDEVLAVGDAAFRQKCLTRIHQLLEEGTSLIFVSHNTWLVQAVCSRAIYLEKGQIKFDGQTQEAVDLYDRDLSEKQAENLDKANSNFSGSETIEITKVDVLGPNGLPSREVYQNQAIKIQVHYVAYQEFNNVNFIIRLIRHDGLTCFMLRSMLDDVQIKVNYGAGVVSVVIDPLQVRGGTFYVQALVRDEHDAGTMTSKTSDFFFVEGSKLSHGQMNGVYEPFRRWINHQDPQSFVDGENSLAQKIEWS